VGRNQEVIIILEERQQIAKMAAKLLTYFACALLVLVPFVTKSEAFGNGPGNVCPNGQTWCNGKKMLMVRTYK